jgi:hypothetical protein
VTDRVTRRVVDNREKHRIRGFGSRLETSVEAGAIWKRAIRHVIPQRRVLGAAGSSPQGIAVKRRIERFNRDVSASNRNPLW